MVGRMLKRNWCPTVSKEFEDMYQGGKPGIVTVVEADNAGTPLLRPYYTTMPGICALIAP
jgi:hypothetical protein